MCDDGRLSCKDYNLEQRLRGARVSGEAVELPAALARVTELVGDGSGVAVLASTRNTCEELFALRTWARQAGVAALWHGAATWQGDEFLKLPDATPNTAGAQELGFVPVPAEPAAAAGAPLRGLIVAGEVAVPAALLAGLEWLVLQTPVATPLAEAATVLLSARTPLEKQGTFVNATGQRQPIAPALAPGEGVPEDWMPWRDLAGAPWTSFRALQRAMAAAGCLPGVPRVPDVAEVAVSQPVYAHTLQA